MTIICSFAIGERYLKELEGMKNSVEKNSPQDELFLLVGEEGNNEFRIHTPQGRERKIQIPLEPNLIKGWNNIGFLKPFVILHCLMNEVKFEDVILWIDADARVRGSLIDLESDMYDADLALVMHNNEWLAGTIAIRKSFTSVTWVEKWWLKCREMMKMMYSDYEMNDQTVMRKLLREDKRFGVLDLGKKYASLPPSCVGSFEEPMLLKPTDEDSLIWHWQASRTNHGWNWPPKEDQR